MSALLQGLSYLVGDGGEEPPPPEPDKYCFANSQRYGVLPTIPLPGAWEITYDVMYSAAAVDASAFGAITNGIRNYHRRRSTGTHQFVFADGPNVEESAVIPDVLRSILVTHGFDGGEWRSRAYVDGEQQETWAFGAASTDFNFYLLAANNNGSVLQLCPAGCTIARLVIKDLDGGKTYNYPLTEGSGTVITNTDPVTGSAFNGYWTPDADWQELPAAAVQATDYGAVPIVDATAAPEHFKNGLPMDGSRLAVDSSSATFFYHQGLPFTANNRVAVGFAPVASLEDGAMPLTAAGRLALGTTPARYTHGVPYTANNQVAYTLS